MQAKSYEIMYVIINKGKASKVLSLAKQHGAKGGTIYLCHGTVKNKVLNFLSIFDEDKEMVITVLEKEESKKVMPALIEKFKFDKPNTGIVFTTSVSQIQGAYVKYNKLNEGVDKPMYKLITTIIDKGKAEDVVDSANKAGAIGATILNARGSGTKETLKIFNMEIEPEKEVVMMIVNSEKSLEIVETINKDMHIDEPGNGIVFVQDISQAYGMYEDNNLK
ncbi:P-II family nitrogen regulator [Helcococcus bovis]|uniref:P-II family nitrogen regulator n=1 Tax=Helcococcus bovis TaxID=3153252 RepID=UPI0038B939C2